MHIAQWTRALRVALACFIPGHASFAEGNGTPPQGADAVDAGGVLNPEACRARLEAQHVAFSFTPPVAEGDCSIPLPVKLRSMDPGGADIKFGAEPVLDCRLALRLTDWIGNVVEPLARHHLGSGLVSVETGPGYACRKQNNVPTAKLSEHAKGNA